MPEYLEATHDLYTKAAQSPDVGLCCTTTPIWKFPELDIPDIMLEMNYGCGSTVHPRDLINNPNILYVGVGGGMELLQFSYFSRKKNGVVGVDIVDDMLSKCAENIEVAADKNEWLNKEFIQLKKGSALSLPIEDASIDVAAQNCLFNIFKKDELKKALAEMYRVLKPHGRLILSDPIANQTMPQSLVEDDQLRAECLSGSIPMQEYLDLLVEIGFGTIEVRARRPYRILAPGKYNTDKEIYIESIEVAAIKDPMPADGPCIFTGKTAIYLGQEDVFDDQAGHILPYNRPIAVCDKTAGNLSKFKDIRITESTWFYDGGGCC